MNATSQQSFDPNQILEVGKTSDYYYKTLKERIVVYTIPDKKYHYYFTSMEIDVDKNDILTTCTLTCPYDSSLMEYFSAGSMSLKVIGGTFNVDNLFIGRVRACNQKNYEIELVCENIGWKFKMPMKSEFESSLVGKNVEDVVKTIMKQLKIPYIIKLEGTPDLDKYKYDSNNTITKGDETVEEIPELETAIAAIGESSSKMLSNNISLNKSFIPNYEKEKPIEPAQNMTVLNMRRKDRADVYRIYRKYVHYDEDGKLQYVDSAYIDSQLSKNPNLLVDLWGNADSAYTYDDVLSNIASAIDAHYYIVGITTYFISSTVLYSYNLDELHAPTDYIPHISLDTVEDGTFDLGISQYGMYNTVKMKYKNGTVTVSYPELVRVYGEVVINYEEPSLSYTQARALAQSYLSAHVRDFGMELQLTCLYSPDYYVNGWVWVKNPLTGTEDLMYIYGMSIVWSADEESIIADMDLRYGPMNPDNPEIPEVGNEYSGDSGQSGVYTGGISADIAEAARQMSLGATGVTGAKNVYNWFVDNVPYSLYHDSAHSIQATLNGTASNCWDQALAMYDIYTALGYRTEMHSGTCTFSTGSTFGHAWIVLNIGGVEYKVDGGRSVSNYFGTGFDITVHSDRIVKQNY